MGLFDFKTWLVRDVVGAPKTGLVPTVLVYKNRLGVDVTKPAVVALGGGLYGFAPGGTDVSGGTIWVVDNGALASPETRYAYGALHSDDDPFIVSFLTDSFYALWTGVAPTIGVYKDATGVDRISVAPAFTSVGGLKYLYYAQPTAAEATIGVVARIDAPNGAGPANDVVSVYSGGGDLIAWLVTDIGDMPDAAAVVTLDVYKDRLGTNRTKPTVMNFGGGVFGFLGTADDVSTGTAVLVNNGTATDALSRYQTAVLSSDSDPFDVFVITTATGALWAGAAPTLGIYVTDGGSALTAPTLSALVGAYLYVLQPLSTDLQAGVSYRFDSPASALPDFMQGNLLKPETGQSVQSEARAATALREWLLMKLPSKVTAVNAIRAAKLLSPYAGPFTVPSGAVLKHSATAIDGTYTSIPLTSGSRTAAQVAADINGVVANLASSDPNGRLLLTASNAPTASVPSLVALGQDNSTGANAAFGWDAGGERNVRYALVAPTYKGVADGWPVAPDMGPGFWIIIGDRESVPVPPATRRDEYMVGLELTIMHKETNVSPHRSREHIHSVVQCVREVLLTSEGRQLGRAAFGDIVFVDEKKAQIAGKPFAFKGPNAPNVLFDVAVLILAVRVFERPASS